MKVMYKTVPLPIIVLEKVLTSLSLIIKALHRVTTILKTVGEY